MGVESLSEGNIFQEVALILDLPFLSWIVSRRIPVFAVVVAVIVLVGNIFVSRVNPLFFASAKIEMTPDFLSLKTDRTQRATDFEYLNFKATNSKAMADLTTKWGPLESRSQIHFDPRSQIITIGLYQPSAEAAKNATKDLVDLFLTTAQDLHRQSLASEIAFRQAEVDAHRFDLQNQFSLSGSTITDPSDLSQLDTRKTSALLTAAMERLARGKALMLLPNPEVLRVIAAPTLPFEPSGPQKGAMLLALIAFAIFCALITVLILEWLDTVIRRPRDIERNLGLSTFGVIPELQPQPIKK